MDNSKKVKAFAERLREVRVVNRLTQEELAEKMGVNPTTIRRFERGSNKNIKDSIIQQVANMFNVNEDWLIGESEIMIEKDNSLNDKEEKGLFEFLNNKENQELLFNAYFPSSFFGVHEKEFDMFIQSLKNNNFDGTKVLHECKEYIDFSEQNYFSMYDSLIYLYNTIRFISRLNTMQFDIKAYKKISQFNNDNQERTDIEKIEYIEKNEEDFNIKYSYSIIHTLLKFMHLDRKDQELIENLINRLSKEKEEIEEISI